MLICTNQNFYADYVCPPNGNVRLNGNDYYQGRAEVCDNSAWTCFCGDSFSRQHGELICSQLGFPGLYRYSTGPSSCSSGATSLQCPEDTTSIQNCNYTVATTSCLQVYVECYSKSIYTYSGNWYIIYFQLSHQSTEHYHHKTTIKYV